MTKIKWHLPDIANPETSAANWELIALGYKDERDALAIVLRGIARIGIGKGDVCEEFAHAAQSALEKLELT